MLPVRLYGDPVLRQPATPVLPPDPKLNELSRVLENTMREAEGIGLAAPQIGISLQIAVVDLRKIEKRPSSMELFGKPVDWRVHMPHFNSPQRRRRRGLPKFSQPTRPRPPQPPHPNGLSRSER